MSDLVGNPEDRFSRVAAQMQEGLLYHHSDSTIQMTPTGRCMLTSGHSTETASLVGGLN